MTFSIPAIVTALLATGASLVASMPLEGENNLEARQAPSVIRLYREPNFQGPFSDMGIEKNGVCQPISTTLNDGVTSFKLGVWRCRFFEHPDCTGRSQWFDSDWSDLARGGGNFGYSGNLNDIITSASCVL